MTYVALAAILTVLCIATLTGLLVSRLFAAMTEVSVNALDQLADARVHFDTQLDTVVSALHRQTFPDAAKIDPRLEQITNLLGVDTEGEGPAWEPNYDDWTDGVDGFAPPGHVDAMGLGADEEIPGIGLDGVGMPAPGDDFAENLPTTLKG